MKEGKTQVQAQVVHYSLVKVASSRSRIVALAYRRAIFLIARRI